MSLQAGSLLVLALCAAGCVTTKDAAFGGDARLDEDQVKDAAVKAAGRACGPEVPGDVVLLDARTGGPVTCLSVTLSREPATCAVGSDCPTEVLFKGHTSGKGQVRLLGPLERSRLVAVAEGFAPSWIANATSAKDRVLELELAPEEGFWLKVLDPEGNYLSDLTVTFKQGTQTIAQLRTNTLANVFFAQRQPFEGQPVTVEADGYQSVTISAVNELGDDGHTLTLPR